jgi:hypothetical protein
VKHISTIPSLLTFGALLTAITFSSASAHAATAIAADLDYAAPIDSTGSSGAGFAIRAGAQLHVPMLVLTPELACTDHTFSSRGPTAYRGLAGLRLGVGEVLRPGVFAHLGFGHLSLPSPAPSHTAFSYDAGAFLDFTLLPVLDLGVHGAYNRLNEGNGVAAFQWATLGVHAALIF